MTFALTHSVVCDESGHIKHVGQGRGVTGVTNDIREQGHLETRHVWFLRVALEGAAGINSCYNNA